MKIGTALTSKTSIPCKRIGVRAVLHKFNFMCWVVKVTKRTVVQ